MITISSSKLSTMKYDLSINTTKNIHSFETLKVTLTVLLVQEILKEMTVSL